MPTAQTFTATAYDADDNPVSLAGKTVTWATTLPNVMEPDGGTGATNVFALHQAGMAYAQATVDGVTGQSLVTVEVGSVAPNQSILDLVAATGGDGNWPTLRDTRYGLTKDGANAVSALSDARLASSPAIGDAVPQSTAAKPTYDPVTGMIYGTILSGGDTSGLTTPSSSLLDLSSDGYLIAIGIFDEGEAATRYVCGIADGTFNNLCAISALQGSGAGDVIGGYLTTQTGGQMSSGVAVGATRRLVIVKQSATLASVQVPNHAAGTGAVTGAAPSGARALRLLGANALSSSRSKLGFVGFCRTLTGPYLATLLAFAQSEWAVVAAT